MSANRNMDRYFETSVKKTGNLIFHHMENRIPGLFNTRSWNGKIMEFVMRDEGLKIALFRFIDALPSLRNDESVAKLFSEYMGDINNLPSLLKTFLPRKGFLASLAGKQIRNRIEALASGFIGGSTMEQVFKTIQTLQKKGHIFTIDLLGEAVLSDLESEIYRSRYLQLLDALDGLSPLKREVNSEEAICRDNRQKEISIKISAFFSRIDPVNFQGSLDKLYHSIIPVIKKARSCSIGLTFDMEHYAFKDLTIALFEKIMQTCPEFKGLGIALQAYLPETAGDLKRILKMALKYPGRKIAIRLVKGAYWDYETISRKREGWVAPVFASKWQTDQNYESLADILLQNTKIVRPAFGTHNVRSAAYIISRANSIGLPQSDFEFQALFGMAEPVKYALTTMGFQLREYVPVGEFLPGMAYFVRRLLENTSNESFLRQTFYEKKSKKERISLLEKPGHKYKESIIQKKESSQGTGFVNFPVPDFSQEESRRDFDQALFRLEKINTREISPVINGKKIETKHKIESENPSDPIQIIGRVSMAGLEEASRAVASANHVSAMWQNTPVNERVGYLYKAADWLEKNIFEMAAVQLLEVGKNRREALADVAEAIDFMRFYGSQTMNISQGEKFLSYAGENNAGNFIPRGVAAVIAPWNFPLAISAGMTSAALVTGNTVIYKPSSLSPVTGFMLMEAFRYAGLPNGVLNFLPGPGSLIGDYLAGHPQIDMLVFTGSVSTALDIHARAAKTQNPRNIKKIIAETGGKNAIILDDSADPDEAANGILSSFLGYQGQKCSACSRLIILESRYEETIRRLIQIVENFPIGPPSDPSNLIGPVIDSASVKKIRSYVSMGKKEATLRFSGMKIPDKGYYVSPVIFSDVPLSARIAREEIFGPVLSVMKAKDINEAIDMANATSFALTGGIYSRSPKNIEMARKYFRVGNLYINRKITGALVNRQPFGGFGLSGTGSKAGSKDYLYHFLTQRVISENTIRRGFAPDSEKP